jgi:hypothetical protein
MFKRDTLGENITSTCEHTRTLYSLCGNNAMLMCVLDFVLLQELNWEKMLTSVTSVLSY